MKTEKLLKIRESELINILQKLGVPVTKKVTQIRKRGRPKKQTTDTIEVKQIRKRGRPRKEVWEWQPTAEKKRGRPSKLSPEVLSKKKRGRPRKYEVELLHKPELDIIPLLIRILKNSSKPLHTNKLVSEVNRTLDTKFPDTTIRKVINYIRAKSLSPIVSVNGNGYEITTNKKKIQAQIDSLNKRASCIISSANGLKNFL